MMMSLENYVISKLQTAGQSRRNGSSRKAARPHAKSSVTKTPPPKLREARLSDYEAVSELKRRCDLVPDSLENWERLWLINPALRNAQFQPPIGWVLESEGRLVGYLGNISLLCRYGDKRLIAVTGCGFSVEPAYRAVSFCLVGAFYRQRHVDLYLTTTASKVVEGIAKMFKSEPLPQKNYGTLLFWVVDQDAFARSVVSKLGLGSTLSYLGGKAASIAVSTDKILRGRWPKSVSSDFEIVEKSVRDVGDEFQVFWDQKLKEPPRLLAERTPAMIRWHFEISGLEAKARVLCCYRNRELIGYAVIDEKIQGEQLKKSVVIDMLAKQDDPAALTALMAGAYDHARRAGSHILEASCFPSSVLQLCSKWKPFMIPASGSPFYYKAVDPELHKTLSHENAWYATPFDGDTTL